MEIACNAYEWSNLPDTIDERFLEIGLFSKGEMIYFNDEEDQLEMMEQEIKAMYQSMLIDKETFLSPLVPNTITNFLVFTLTLAILTFLLF